ncbi:MAG: 1,6-anhydro-N-acetylmuramyl-L-alanine amidase AmpD [Methylococcaceae bacterium]|nr:1,6-anhydro-N-acetylmuramyl-L-alanine amidase AmpD [Methylococcaceae bacterium]
MSINSNHLTNATWLSSPNFDDRPDPTDISLIVIHCISLPPGEFDNDHISQLFTNALNPNEHAYFEQIHQLKVSSHLLIKRTGQIIQYVPFDKRAWHAGKSDYQGRERCNDFSIGIELEGTECTDYTTTQYEQLAKVINALLAVYPKLSRQRITGHCDIAPGRKTDPGASFDWKKLYLLLN